jgi:periplasmic divalent cation tolerance protein
MQEANTTDILSVTTTVATRAAAQLLAREILAQRLAACVQIEDGLHSMYWWQGELCEEPEARLVIKTLPHCEQALHALFTQHHPYEVPQFLAARMKASPSYFEWASAQLPSAGATG